MKKKVYLCGPITGCTDPEVYIWRQYLKAHCQGFEMLDPLRNDLRMKTQPTQNDVGDAIWQDIRDVQDCDILVRNCFKPSDGSAMEQIFAHARGKHVVIIVPDKVEISHWTKFFAHVAVESVEEAAVYLNQFPRF